MNSSQWQAVQEVFGQALEQKTNAQSVFIKQACANDPSLLVLSRGMLQAHRDAAGFMEQPALNNFRDEGGSSPDRLPKRIGPFRIQALLGEGGMGTVYLAQSKTKRYVALKMVRSELADREKLARLSAEGEILARLRHPNIIRYYDAGSTRKGQPYFTMEYFRGKNIIAFCKDRQLGLLRRIELFLQICSGIHHAHTRGIIHLDLKPTNLMAAEKRGRIIAKVIDFGIAGRIGHLSDSPARCRGILGTPAYMSPEQAAADDLDIRGDIYSLGAVLYQLLTDEPPFEPTQINESPWQEVAQIICEKEPELPSNRVLHGPKHLDKGGRGPLLARQLTGDLDRIVMKTLAKKRAGRYSSIPDLARDLHCYLEKFG